MYKTKLRKGNAIQYRGDISVLEKALPNFTFVELKSSHTFNGEEYPEYPDYRVITYYQEEDLLAGDWIVYNKDDWFVVPMIEFEEYWEKE
jgi:hypothetical protein